MKRSGAAQNSKRTKLKAQSSKEKKGARLKAKGGNQEHEQLTTDNQQRIRNSCFA